MPPELGNQYPEATHVEMEDVFDFAEAPRLIYTDGLGPCIGICVAWQEWAGVAHLAIYNENHLPEFIKQAKEVLPNEVVPNIRPIFCGGEPDQDVVGELDADPDQVLQAREIVVDAFKNAGFGEPHVQWNEMGESASIVAYLKHGFVRIERNPGGNTDFPIFDAVGVDRI